MENIIYIYLFTILETLLHLSWGVVYPEIKDLYGNVIHAIIANLGLLLPSHSVKEIYSPEKCHSGSKVPTLTTEE